MSKNKSMTSPKGVYSSSSNPMKPASSVKPMCGPGMNSNQKKANSMLQAQQMKEASRGKSGM